MERFEAGTEYSSDLGIESEVDIDNEVHTQTGTQIVVQTETGAEIVVGTETDTEIVVDADNGLHTETGVDFVIRIYVGKYPGDEKVVEAGDYIEWSVYREDGEVSLDTGTQMALLPVVFDLDVMEGNYI